MFLSWDPWTAFWSAMAAWMAFGAALMFGFWATLFFWPLLFIAVAVTMWALVKLPDWLARASEAYRRRHEAGARHVPPEVTILPPASAGTARAEGGAASAGAPFALRGATLRVFAFVGLFTILIALWFGLATALGVGAILALILALFPVAPLADRAARWLTRRLAT